MRVDFCLHATLLLFSVCSALADYVPAIVCTAKRVMWYCANVTLRFHCSIRGQLEGNSGMEKNVDSSNYRSAKVQYMANKVDLTHSLGLLYYLWFFHNLEDIVQNSSHWNLPL